MVRTLVSIFLLLSAMPLAAAPLYPVPSGDRIGFINDAGLLLIKPVYDEVGTLADGMWPVRQGNKWGFVNEDTQSLSVSPRFTDAARFSEGLCAVVWKGKIGYIGRNGRWQVPPQFHQEDTFGLWKDNTVFKEGVAGAYLTEEQAKQAGYPGEAGFIDRTGKWFISPRFHDVEPFSDGMAKVEFLKEYDLEEGYTNRDGKHWLLPEGCVGLFAEPFFEGLAAIPKRIKHKNGETRLYGFLDKQGKWAIPPRFLTVAPSGLFYNIRQGFQDGICPVLEGTTRENARLGWIDTSGKWMIEPRFTGGAGGASGSPSPAAKGERVGEGLAGYIDRTGKYVIEPIYEKVGQFQEGITPVKKPTQKWSYIDLEGREVIPPRFDYAPLHTLPANEVMGLQFYRGLAWVHEGQRQGYINRAGKWVWVRAKPKL